MSQLNRRCDPALEPDSTDDHDCHACRFAAPHNHWALGNALFSADSDIGRPTANCEATPRSVSSARHLAGDPGTWRPSRTADLACKPLTGPVTQRESGSDPSAAPDRRLGAHHGQYRWQCRHVQTVRYALSHRQPSPAPCGRLAPTSILRCPGDAQSDLAPLSRGTKGGHSPGFQAGSPRDAYPRNRGVLPISLLDPLGVS